jgi:hypothetical protein
VRALHNFISDIGGAADSDRALRSAHPRIFICIRNIARFLPLLHEAISEGLAEAVDDIQVAGALQLGDGWMHIHGQQSNILFYLPVRLALIARTTAPREINKNPTQMNATFHL